MAEEDTAYYISQSLSELPTDEELKVLHGFARYFDIRVTEGYMVKKAINYDFWQDHLKAVIGFATNYELEDFKQSEEESLDYIRKFVKADSNCNFTYEDLKAVIVEHEAFLRSRKQSATNDKRIEALVQAKRRLDRPTLGILKNIDSSIGSPKGYGPPGRGFPESYGRTMDKSNGLRQTRKIYPSDFRPCTTLEREFRPIQARQKSA